jgi:hypothetical protein
LNNLDKLFSKKNGYDHKPKESVNNTACYALDYDNDGYQER